MPPGCPALPAELFEAALRLPPAARRELADRLYASLDAEPEAMKQAWQEEIAYGSKT